MVFEHRESHKHEIHVIRSNTLTIKASQLTTEFHSGCVEAILTATHPRNIYAGDGALH